MSLRKKHYGFAVLLGLALLLGLVIKQQLAAQDRAPAQDPETPKPELFYKPLNATAPKTPAATAANTPATANRQPQRTPGATPATARPGTVVSQKPVQPTLTLDAGDADPFAAAAQSEGTQQPSPTAQVWTVDARGPQAAPFPRSANAPTLVQPTTGATDSETVLSLFGAPEPSRNAATTASQSVTSESAAARRAPTQFTEGAEPQLVNEGVVEAARPINGLAAPTLPTESEAVDADPFAAAMQNSIPVTQPTIQTISGTQKPGSELQNTDGFNPVPVTAAKPVPPSSPTLNGLPSLEDPISIDEPAESSLSIQNPQLELRTEADASETPTLEFPAERKPQASPALMEESQTMPILSPTRQQLPATDTFGLPPSEPAIGEPLLQPVEPAEDASVEDVYQVESGDNYWTISRKFFGSARYFAALAEHNKHRIPNPDKMKPGMYVLIPTVATMQSLYPKLAGSPPTDPADAPPLGFFVDESGQPAYRVGKGDTLTDIAEKHLGRSSRWMQIYAMNRENMRDVNTLKIGSVLRLPADATQVQMAPPVSETR